jgi:hypothetical protein
MEIKDLNEPIEARDVAGLVVRRRAVDPQPRRKVMH